MNKIKWHLLSKKARIDSNVFSVFFNETLICISFFFFSRGNAEESNEAGAKPSIFDEQIHLLTTQLAELKEEVKGIKNDSVSHVESLFFKAPCFVTADFLYWTVKENGLAFAIRNDSTSLVADHGKMENLDFQWHPGFKIGVGTFLPHDYWNIYLNFTHLHIKAVKNVKEDKESVLFPIWINAAAFQNGFVQEADAHWRLHMGVLDLDLGRDCAFSNWFKFHPFIGLRGAILRQKYILHYKGGTLFPDDEDRISMKNKFFGGGLRFGADSLWKLTSCLSIYGDAALSILYGYFRIHESELSSNAVSKDLNIFNRFHLSSAVTDLALGFEYNYHFVNSLYDLSFRIGWEHHVFFGQNQFIRFVDTNMQGANVSNQGDLTFQGLTLGAKFAF